MHLLMPASDRQQQRSNICIFKIPNGSNVFLSGAYTEKVSQAFSEQSRKESDVEV
jgi:hypothetical protein